MNRPIPNFHASGTRNWQIADNILRFLEPYVPLGSSTLETGAGVSTVFFAQRGALHTVITPDQGEIDRIKAYSEAIGVSTANVRFIRGLSQDVMPTLTTPIDFMLVDGLHGFPVPAIDWFYGAKLLRQGGVIALDDIHTWPVAIVRRCLMEDPAWEHLGTIDHKTSAFRLIGKFEPLEFNQQPYPRAKSRTLLNIRKIKRFGERAAKGQWGQMSKSFMRALHFKLKA